MIVDEGAVEMVILPFWLVLAFDLLENRRTIDEIITKFHPLRFKITESFENLDNILHDCAKDKVQKSLVVPLNGLEKQEEERYIRFSFRKWFSHRFISNLTNCIIKMFLRLIYLQNWIFPVSKMFTRWLMSAMKHKTSQTQFLKSVKINT